MVPVKPWKLEAVARLLMTLCLCLFVFALLQQYVLPRDQDSNVTQLAGIVSLQGMVLVLAWLLLRENKLSWADAFGFRFEGLGKVLQVAFVAAGIAMLAVFGLQLGIGELMKWMNIEPNAQEAVQMIQAAQGPVHLGLLAVVTLITAPVAEEILFRGILYPTIKQAGYPRAALWGTSILFAVIHFNLAGFIPLTFLAVVFTIAYERSNSLLAPILVHMLFNAENFVRLLLMDRWSG